MAAAKIIIGPPTDALKAAAADAVGLGEIKRGDLPSGSEFIGLLAAVERYGLPYSSLRAWVKSGLIPSWTTPNRRLWIRPADIEQKLFRRVEPKTTPTRED
jgi:hypothetical protein